MKAFILVLLIQHPIISARAGLVTLIDGLVDHDVSVQDHTRTHPLVEWNAERRKEVQDSCPFNFDVDGMSF